MCRREWNLHPPRRAVSAGSAGLSAKRAPVVPRARSVFSIISIVLPETIPLAVKGSPAALDRQIDLTTAVCQERLLTTHVRHVLAMVDLISDRVPFDQALDIYVRMMRLNPEQARNVGSRALAEIGRRGGTGADHDLSFLDEEEAPAAEPEPSVAGRADAVFSRLRRRIRGRVEDELRNRIDLVAARTEDAILDTHVENALIFVKALDDHMSAPEAIDRYLDIMIVSEGQGDVIYNKALRSIADAVLPPLPPRRDKVGAAADAGPASAAPAAT